MERLKGRSDDSIDSERRLPDLSSGDAALGRRDGIDDDSRQKPAPHA